MMYARVCVCSAEEERRTRWRRWRTGGRRWRTGGRRRTARRAARLNHGIPKGRVEEGYGGCVH
jgi:hypothetical protein